MKRESPRLAETKLADAMMLMRQALQLLDETQAPGDIGAHLDLAIERLGRALPNASCHLTKRDLSMPVPEMASRSTG
jgi:hypothetical protein